MEWPHTIEEAVSIQDELRTRLRLIDEPQPPQTVAGVDAGFEAEGTIARAAVVVLSFPDLKPLAYTVARAPAEFPYIPGFLSFREAPAILLALSQLSIQPDLIICDGQGIAHPRRMGIASHIGVLLDRPTIGCAKSRLTGYHTELPPERGARVPLRDRKEQIGWVLRSRSNVRPLYVSPGHRVSLDSAVELVFACTTRYRLPETTRLAHNLASNGIAPPI